MQFASTARPPATSPAPGPDLLRVLLIEDDPEDAGFARQALSALPRFTCVVQWVSTYDEALPALRAREYDLVVLDHNLGGRTGLALLAEAFEGQRAVPVVLLTGMTGSGEIDRMAERAGVSDLLEKGQLQPAALERSIGYALERSRTERDLRSTRAFFHAAFDALHDHVAILSADGTIIEANHAWETFAADNGYLGPRSARGANYLAVCDAASGPEQTDGRSAAAGIRAVIEGSQRNFELEYPCHAPGEERWFLMRVRRFDDSGNIRILVAHENVTAAYVARQELRERDERYRLVNRVTKDIIWDWDLRSGDLVWNDAVEVLRSPRDGALTREWWTANIHPDDRDRVLKGLNEVVDDGETSWTDEYRFRRPDASYATFHDRGYVLREPGGRAVRVIGSMADVTERRRNEERLQQSEARYRLLFDRNPLPMWLIQPDRLAFIATNDAAVEHYGFSRDEFLTMTPLDLVPAADRETVLQTQRALRADKTQAVSTRHQKKSGEIIEVEVVVHQVLFDGEVTNLAIATDMTGRNRAERERASALQLLGTVVDASPVAIIAADAEMRTTMWNPASTSLLGWREDEMLGRTASVIPPERSREFEFVRAERAAGRPVVNLETYLLRKDGSRVNVLLSTTALHDAAGKVTGSVALLSDITERKRTEAAREVAEQEREQLFRTLEYERNRLTELFRIAPAFIVVLRGPDHVFELANDAYYDLVGRRTLIGLPAVEALPELADQGLKEIIDDVLATGRPFVMTQRAVRVQRVAGEPMEERFLSLSYQALVEADGTRSGIMCHGIDITEQVRAEHAIRASEERYRALVELSPDGIVIHDGRIIHFANPAAIALVGASSSAQLVGRTVLEFIHEKSMPLAEERISRLTGGGPTGTVAQVWKGVDGRPRDVEVASMPFTLAGQAMIQTVFRDISERQQLEDQLRQAQKMEAVGRLAGGVAHDFNNLLTVIQANTEFLLADLDMADPRRADAVEIRSSCDRASGLTRQLLAFSRKQILEPRPLDLRAVVAGVKSMLTRIIGEDVTLEIAVRDTVGSVMGDAGQIEQVLMNLVINARDAMPDGGRILIELSDVELTEQYAIADRAQVLPGSYVRLAVSDTGKGMTPDVRARIFEPFFTTKPVGQGTGLGLATAYGIVKQSAGHIWVYSEAGLGTTFKVYLPRIGEARAAAASTNVSSAPRRGSETILLVEDESALRSVAHRMLTSQGYTVMEAANGREALDIAMKHPGTIDLVLTDVVMPEMSGGALAERLRGVRPEARMLFMSGYTDGDIVRRGVLQPGISFIQKPFAAARLFELVRETLDKE